MGTYLNEWRLFSKPSIGSSWFLFIGWKIDIWELAHEIKQKFSLHVILQNIINKQISFISNAYGPRNNGDNNFFGRNASILK